MNLLAVGVSHHTAPVEVRERLAVGSDALPRVLQQLRQDHMGDEALLISTCNRVELYAVSEANSDPDRLAGWLAANGGLSSRSADPHIYRFARQDALKHLFRVASSLDSMVIGEPQILGQVKDSWRQALESQAVGPVLHRVMDSTFHVAKRVRTETEIGREAVSVGRSGVELARQVLGSLNGRSALLVGAGAHGKLVARSLLDFGLGELVVCNRTFAKAVEFAELFGGSAVHMEEMPRYLERVDIAMASTGAGHILVNRADLAPIMRRRRYRSLVLIDLSVPRNIAPDVNDLDGVFRFDVDDLVQLAAKGAERRKAAAEAAERIVAEETDRCWRMLLGETLNKEIGALARSGDAIRKAELERAHTVLEKLDPADRKAIEAMSKAIVKKLMHGPMSQARALAEEGDTDSLQILLNAFKNRDS